MTPRYLLRGQIFSMLDESPVGEMLQQQVKQGEPALHLMGVLGEGDDEDQMRVFVAAPEFVAEIIRDGERLPDEDLPA
jgi:hypothetical protein